MDYDVGGSGALAFDVPYAVITFFGYNLNTECLLRDYYSADEWNQRLAAELTAGRPVIYCGHDPCDTAGHAFVVDGCRGSDSKVHVNWGWDGDYDGYYVLSSLNPASYRFTTHQTMVAQFCPDVAGTHEDVAYADHFTVSGDDILPDEPEPTPDAGGIVWQEGFESGNLPSTIVENSIQGSGEWEVVQVLFSQSNAMPEAATGHGYALLRNRGIGLSGRRVVNRLVTDDIAMPTGQRNSVAVQVRRHSTSPNSDDALSLYFYTSDGGWRFSAGFPRAFPQGSPALFRRVPGSL